MLGHRGARRASLRPRTRSSVVPVAHVTVPAACATCGARPVRRRRGRVMRFRPSSVLLAIALTASGATPALAATAAPPDLVRDPTAYVDPLIGTKNGGNVFPGAVAPFGMLSWSPENTRGSATSTAAPGGYQYDATRIRGFSLTHMSGTGCAGGSGDIPSSRTRVRSPPHPRATPRTRCTQPTSRTPTRARSPATTRWASPPASPPTSRRPPARARAASPTPPTSPPRC